MSATVLAAMPLPAWWVQSTDEQTFSWKTMKHLVAALFAAVLFCGAAQAQSLEEIDKRDAAVIEAWNATPLTVRRAIFVTEHPDAYGDYIERPDNVFKKGDKLITYAEPVGYGWKDIGGGFYQFGFKVDFLVKTVDGKVVGGQEDFADLTKKSRAHLRDFMVVLNLTLGNTAPGSYVVEYKLRDVTNDKTYTISQPFKIVD
jgi:hypothetical protein